MKINFDECEKQAIKDFKKGKKVFILQRELANEYGGILKVEQTNVTFLSNDHNSAEAMAKIVFGFPEENGCRRFLLKPMPDEEVLAFCDVPRWYHERKIDD